MNTITMIDAISYLDNDLLEKHFAKKESLKAKKIYAAKNLCLRIGAVACVFVFVACASIFIYNDYFVTTEPAQTVTYNGFEYYICGDEGEAAILKECGLPEDLTAELAGEPIGYLSGGENNRYIVSDKKTDIRMFEYAPQPNENIYIVEIDGDYYAAIKHTNGKYNGLTD